jgi:primase-polymerase (primpol)-like protein
MTQTAITPALEELQSLNHWVVWKLEDVTNKRTGETRPTKVLYNANNGHKASSTDPRTWTTYKLAIATYEKYPNDYCGIGFVFTGSGFTGVDCDHCIDSSGNIDSWAQDIIHHFNSFHERSPNDGIHIYIRSEMPEKTIKGEVKHPGRKFKLKGMRHPDAAIEMYSEGRFFTWTGRTADGAPDNITHAQDALNALINRLDTKPEKEHKQYAPPPGLDDNELIEKALKARNGSKFHSLYRNGDIGAYGDDDSAADQALCDMLAFWTGKDAGRMDSLFRTSTLMREKWDEPRGSQTYGEITIDTAIRGCTEIYTGQSNGHTRPISRNSDISNPQNELPEFIIEGQLRDQEKKAFEVLAKANETNPKLFMHLSTASKVTEDEEDRPIIQPMDRAGIRHELSCAANFYIRKKKNEETDILVDAHPPKDLADQLLVRSPKEWPLSVLRAIVEAPVLRRDGSILDKPGYDATSKLYYVPAPGMERCKIPTNPTRDDARKAMDFLRPMFVDFPFESESDRANTFALLFTPFVRHAIKKDIQLALIDATNAGTGKGLITSIVSIVATGKHTPVMSAKQDDTEWRKTILTELLSGPRIVIIDNIRGILESASLEAVLTAESFTERILGQSKSARAKNEATWIATGNNLLIGGDLPRRCYRIRLIAEQANPDERPDESFVIPQLEDWAMENRPEIVSAILTIARAWYVVGKPKPTDVPNLGTFSDWAKTIGGMLEYAGMKGFQQNRAELRSRNSEEAEEWEAFLTAWHERFGEVWKVAAEIAKEISKTIEKEITENTDSQQLSANPLFESLPQYLKKALADKPNSFSITLTRALGTRVQTVYGSRGYRLEKDKNDHTKAKLWRVVRRVADSFSKATQGKNLLSSCDDDSVAKSDMGNGGKNYPQPSASKNGNHDSSDYTANGNGIFAGTGFADSHEQKVNTQNLKVGQWINCHRGYGQINHVGLTHIDIDIMGNKHRVAIDSLT